MRIARRAFPRVWARTYATMEEEIAAAYKDTKGASGGPSRKLTQLQFSIDNKKPGSLFDSLEGVKAHGINIESITTRAAPDRERLKAITVFMDLNGTMGEDNVQNAVQSIRENSIHLQVIHSCEIPWYATKISDIDLFNDGILAAGGELTSDHPGFQDKEYRRRRDLIAKNASTFKYGDELPTVEYSADETKTWGMVWDRLMELYPTHACKEYQYNFSLMVENCGYRKDQIPQLEDISQYLQYRTGFSIRPVTGLLSPRNFLNALAFRVFHSTQYIRHPSNPYYTPEPDVIHELMGHTVLFADPAFADFTQAIGLASLGASDEEIEKLASCYWFSVEFGLCRQEGSVRAYGAGLLGSFGELKYSLSGPGDGTEENGPKYLPWEPEVAAVTQYPITKYQPTYFVAESFDDAKVRMENFAKSFARPFTLEYNPYTKSVKTITKNCESYLAGH
eukprot:TRINITY_DN8647_c0_g1_i1.p1 TRINITY_DN8647_c0_g1~~TRINITY_DN8647_c0_g1_i1.p1  ORF type:complete len:450 (+),score=152.79 TRINITY_DN8647_c0_g1_i1:82-1431(+)